MCNTCNISRIMHAGVVIFYLFFQNNRRLTSSIFVRGSCRKHLINRSKPSAERHQPRHPLSIFPVLISKGLDEPALFYERTEEKVKVGKNGDGQTVHCKDRVRGSGSRIRGLGTGTEERNECEMMYSCLLSPVFCLLDPVFWILATGPWTLLLAFPPQPAGSRPCGHRRRYRDRRS